MYVKTFYKSDSYLKIQLLVNESRATYTVKQQRTEGSKNKFGVEGSNENKKTSIIQRKETDENTI